MNEESAYLRRLAEGVCARVNGVRLVRIGVSLQLAQRDLQIAYFEDRGIALPGVPVRISDLLKGDDQEIIEYLVEAIQLYR